MNLLFDTKGNDKQKLCATYWADDETEEIIYGGSKGSAKSFTGCSLIFGDALTYPGIHLFIARKTLEHLKKFTLPSIYEVLEGWGIDSSMYNYNAQDHVFTMYNDSKVFLLPAKYMPSDPLYARFGSMQMTRGWIEEAGEFDLNCKNNLFISVGRWKNDLYGLKRKLLQTCNPSKNYLYQDYKKNKEGELEDWKKFIQALPSDNKMLAEGYLEGLHRTLNGSERERLLFGNWEYDDDPNALIEYDAILDLWTNKGEDGQKAITADIAFNNDNFVIVVWDGWKEIDMIVKQGVKPNEVITLLEQTAAKHGVRQSRVVYDADGLGSYISGWLKTAKPFKNGSKPIVQEVWVDGKKEKVGDEYENLKTQCEFALAKKINAGQVSLTSEKYREEIIADLEQIKQRDSDKDSKLKTTKKEDRKKILGRSPDFSDTLMMRVLLDIAPKKRTYTRGVKV